jgi:hypothetical protein
MVEGVVGSRRKEGGKGRGAMRSAVGGGIDIKVEIGEKK